VESGAIPSMVANLAFLKPDFEILAFLTSLAFFGIQKKPDRSVFFSV